MKSKKIQGLLDKRYTELYGESDGYWVSVWWDDKRQVYWQEVGFENEASHYRTALRRADAGVIEEALRVICPDLRKVKCIDY